MTVPTEAQLLAKAEADAKAAVDAVELAKVEAEKAAAEVEAAKTRVPEKIYLTAEKRWCKACGHVAEVLLTAESKPKCPICKKIFKYKYQKLNGKKSVAIEII